MGAEIGTLIAFTLSGCRLKTAKIDVTWEVIPINTQVFAVLTHPKNYKFGCGEIRHDHFEKARREGESTLGFFC